MDYNSDNRKVAKTDCSENTIDAKIQDMVKTSEHVQHANGTQPETDRHTYICHQDYLTGEAYAIRKARKTESGITTVKNATCKQKL